MLVVIAIIAILAAILFPVFAAAREKARQTTCASNLKQIGLAWTQYVQDYDEFGPFGTEGSCEATAAVGGGGANRSSCGGAPGPGPYTGWNNEIYPYVKNTQVFMCPDALSGQHGVNSTGPLSYGAYCLTGAAGDCPSPNNTTVTGVSYSMNLYLSAITGNYDMYSTAGPGISNAKIAQPANVIEVTEALGGSWQDSRAESWYLATGPIDDSNVGFIVPLSYDPNIIPVGDLLANDHGAPYWMIPCYNNTCQASAGYDTRHSSVRMTLFCDGHVKALPILNPGVTFEGVSYGGTSSMGYTMPAVCSGVLAYSSTAAGCYDPAPTTSWSLEGLRYWIPANTN